MSEEQKKLDPVVQAAADRMCAALVGLTMDMAQSLEVSMAIGGLVDLASRATVPQPSSLKAEALKGLIIDRIEGELKVDSYQYIGPMLDTLCAMAAQAPAVVKKDLTSEPLSRSDDHVRAHVNGSLGYRASSQAPANPSETPNSSNDKAVIRQNYKGTYTPEFIEQHIKLLDAIIADVEQNPIELDQTHQELSAEDQAILERVRRKLPAMIDAVFSIPTPPPVEKPVEGGEIESTHDLIVKLIRAANVEGSCHGGLNTPDATEYARHKLDARIAALEAKAKLCDELAQLVMDGYTWSDGDRKIQTILKKIAEGKR